MFRRDFWTEIAGALLIGAIVPFLLYFELPFRLRMALPYWSPLALSLVGFFSLLVILICTGLGDFLKRTLNRAQ